MEFSFNSGADMEQFSESFGNLSEKSIAVETVEEHFLKMAQEVFNNVNNEQEIIKDADILEQLLFKTIVVSNYYKSKQEFLMSELAENNAQLEIFAYIQKIIQSKIKNCS